MSETSRLAALGLIVFVAMVLEAAVSARHERRLRARGAIEPAGDVIGTMQWAYPACFVAMFLEGLLRGLPPWPWWMAGIGMFALAKALKYWAIASLGVRWTFRVLVLPGEPLITSGPYRCLRHPNYAAVAGELLGVALAAGAWIAGPASALGFGALVVRRIAVEERALGRTDETGV